MRTVALPNGLRVIAPSRIEAATLYREIYTAQTYTRHGVRVSDGDCVFDVGANIGLYSVFLSESHRGLRIFAFEPVPHIFSALERNAGQHLAGSRASLFNLGLSDRRGAAVFEYDRYATLTATMRPAEVRSCVRRGAGMSAWARAGILDLQRIDAIPGGLADFLLRALSAPVAGSLLAAAMTALLLCSLVRKRVFLRRVECRLTTVSEVIREHRLETVDLIKIDVEGSEPDVINGIAEADWPKIRQLVVEVHDVAGRVAAMKSLFESRGYCTTLDQEEWEVHKLINVYTLYAVRPSNHPAH
jgi:31-O-methyltransferase